MTEITDAQLEQWAARAEPISLSSITASSESKFSVMDLAMLVVRLVDEVRRLRRSEAHTPTDDERQAMARDEANRLYLGKRWAVGTVVDREIAAFMDGVVWAAGFHRSAASESSVETWVCGKCGGSAYEHSLTTSTCIWEPIETRPEPQGEPSGSVTGERP